MARRQKTDDKKTEVIGPHRETKAVKDTLADRAEQSGFGRKGIVAYLIAREFGKRKGKKPTAEQKVMDGHLDSLYDVYVEAEKIKEPTDRLPIVEAIRTVGKFIQKLRNDRKV